MLCDAIRQAAAAVRLARPGGSGTAIALTFGAPQGTDVRPIRRDDLAGTGQPLNHQAVANYIAKYATKTLTAPGVPAQRLRHLVDIEHLRCTAHYKQMITTAWQLGGRRQTGDPRFRQWAHMLGYGGHFLTKSHALLGHLRPAPQGPDRPPPRAEPPRRRTRPLGPPRRRDHRPGPRAPDIAARLRDVAGLLIWLFPCSGRVGACSGGAGPQ